MNDAFTLGRSILAAALLMGVSAALSWLAPAYISAELAHRLLGAMLGAMVVAYANAIPKAFAARARQRCSPAGEQAARRFAGWALVLGGLGYMLAWLLAPIQLANPIAGAALGIALLVAVLRYFRGGADGAAT